MHSASIDSRAHPISARPLPPSGRRERTTPFSLSALFHSRFASTQTVVNSSATRSRTRAHSSHRERYSLCPSESLSRTRHRAASSSSQTNSAGSSADFSGAVFANDATNKRLISIAEESEESNALVEHSGAILSRSLPHTPTKRRFSVERESQTSLDSLVPSTSVISSAGMRSSSKFPRQLSPVAESSRLSSSPIASVAVAEKAAASEQPTRQRKVPVRVQAQIHNPANESLIAQPAPPPVALSLSEHVHSSPQHEPLVCSVAPFAATRVHTSQGPVVLPAEPAANASSSIATRLRSLPAFQQMLCDVSRLPISPSSVSQPTSITSEESELLEQLASSPPNFHRRALSIRASRPSPTTEVARVPESASQSAATADAAAADLPVPATANQLSRASALVSRASSDTARALQTGALHSSVRRRLRLCGHRHLLAHPLSGHGAAAAQTGAQVTRTASVRSSSAENAAPAPEPTAANLFLLPLERRNLPLRTHSDRSASQANANAEEALAAARTAESTGNLGASTSRERSSLVSTTCSSQQSSVKLTEGTSREPAATSSATLHRNISCKSIVMTSHIETTCTVSAAAPLERRSCSFREARCGVGSRNGAHRKALSRRLSDRLLKLNPQHSQKQQQQQQLAAAASSSSLDRSTSGASATGGDPNASAGGRWSKQRSRSTVAMPCTLVSSTVVTHSQFHLALHPVVGISEPGVSSTLRPAPSISGGGGGGSSSHASSSVFGREAPAGASSGQNSQEEVYAEIGLFGLDAERPHFLEQPQPLSPVCEKCSSSAAQSPSLNASFEDAADSSFDVQRGEHEPRLLPVSPLCLLSPSDGVYDEIGPCECAQAPDVAGECNASVTILSNQVRVVAPLAAVAPGGQSTRIVSSDSADTNVLLSPAGTESGGCSAAREPHALIRKGCLRRSRHPRAKRPQEPDAGDALRTSCAPTAASSAARGLPLRRGNSLAMASMQPARCSRTLPGAYQRSVRTTLSEYEELAPPPADITAAHATVAEATREPTLSRSLQRATRPRRLHPSYPLRSPYSHVRLRPLAHLRAPLTPAAGASQSSTGSTTSLSSEDRSHLPLPARSVHSTCAAVERICSETLADQNSDETYSHISDLRAGAEREPRDDVALALGGDSSEMDLEQFLESFGEADELGSEAYADPDADADADPDGPGTDSDATVLGTDAEDAEPDEVAPDAFLDALDLARLGVGRRRVRRDLLLRQMHESILFGRGHVASPYYLSAIRKRRAKRVKHNYHTVTLLCKLVSLRFSRLSLLSLFDRFAILRVDFCSATISSIV